MAQYTYQQENGEYVFYKDGKPLTPPTRYRYNDRQRRTCEESGGDPDDNAYIKHLKEIGDMIDTFVYYFTLSVR